MSTYSSCNRVCKCGTQYRFNCESVSEFTCRKCGDYIVLKPKEWPLWAKAVRSQRKKNDLGVGDTVQRIAAKFGGEQYKAVLEKLGVPCDCPNRQTDWNKQYPYA